MMAQSHQRKRKHIQDETQHRHTKARGKIGKTDKRGGES